MALCGSLLFVAIGVAAAQHTGSQCHSGAAFEVNQLAVRAGSLMQQSSTVRRNIGLDAEPLPPHHSHAQFPLQQWAANAVNVDANEVVIEAPNLTHLTLPPNSTPPKCRVCIKYRCGSPTQDTRRCSGWSCPGSETGGGEGWWSPGPLRSVHSGSTAVNTRRCSADSGYGSGDANGSNGGLQELLLKANRNRWPQDAFCNTDPEGFPDYRVGEYVVAAQMFNIEPAHVGHLGLAYNVQSADTYEFVYFRPHSPSGCFQTGLLNHGVVQWAGAQSAPCAGGNAPKLAWFGVEVRVWQGHAHIYKDGRLVVDQTNQFPAVATGAMVVASGYSNEAKFKNFTVTVNPWTCPHEAKMECESS